ncbi:hypothetical protein PMAYCL1PPCAC_00871, partial [Pristionchus mayeri]
LQFSSSPVDAKDDVLRSNSPTLPIPVTVVDIFDVIAAPAASSQPERPKKSARLFASEMGVRSWKVRAVRYACAHPSTSFVVTGGDQAGKTEAVAAMAVALPRRHKKLLITTTRSDARDLSVSFADLLKDHKNNTQKDPGHMCTKTRYSDSKKRDWDYELSECLQWMSEDILLATIGSVIQILYFDTADTSDPMQLFLRDVHTVIIDNADKMFEAAFYVMMKTITPTRVILVGNHEKAVYVKGDQVQAAQSILAAIMDNTRMHSLPILQLKSIKPDLRRASFFISAPLTNYLLTGLKEYTRECEVVKLREVLDFLRKTQVSFENVVVLTTDARHKEVIMESFPMTEELPALSTVKDFEGRVKSVVILLGGWYGRRYWCDNVFLDIYSTLHLDVLFFIGSRNIFNLPVWGKQEV